MSDKSKARSVKIKLPQVDLVLRQTPLVELSEEIDRRYLSRLVRDELQGIRSRLIDDAGASSDPDLLNCDEVQVALSVARNARSIFNAGLRRVINGTGVVLNTNLGRAPLPVRVLEEMLNVGQGYSSLEIDVASGKRGDRTEKIGKLLHLLTGCEAGIVVNNNASAVMLVVAALAQDKEVVVSRSELVEIGGSFRLPDVIKSAGGILKEVGTTNKTRAADFEAAVTEKTGIFLRCHRSNFEIRGFTEEASNQELTEIARRRGIPLVDDLGSGAFFDISKYGLKKEPTVEEVIDSGMDLVTFSGDKLLGGPQAGIVAGRGDLVKRVRKNPMYRALRADKLILSLIESVLSLYLTVDPEKELPVLALSAVPSSQIKKRIESFMKSISDQDKDQFVLEIAATESTMGGGSLPGETMESFGLSLACVNETSASKLARMLRLAEPPVIPLIQEERVILDFRTILERDLECLRMTISQINRRLQAG